jgi:hypothetical protein
MNVVIFPSAVIGFVVDYPRVTVWQLNAKNSLVWGMRFNPRGVAGWRIPHRTGLQHSRLIHVGIVGVTDEEAFNVWHKSVVMVG